MESVPPMHYDELATKQATKLMLDTQTEVFRTELKEMRAEMTGEFARVDVRIAELSSDLKGDMARLDLRMAQQLRITVLAHVGSMIGLAAFLSSTLG